MSSNLHDVRRLCREEEIEFMAVVCRELSKLEMEWLRWGVRETSIYALPPFSTVSKARPDSLHTCFGPTNGRDGVNN